MRPSDTAKCPECGKQLPWGDGFRSEERAGLTDKRELDCPYCGAPLEPIRWTTLIPLFAILGLAVAARILIGPLLDWKIILALLGIAAVYHAVELRNLRKTRRELRGRESTKQHGR